MTAIATTEAQKRATAKWRAKATKSYAFRFHRENDADIIAYLDAVDNRHQFIRDAVRDTIKKEKKGADNA